MISGIIDEFIGGIGNRIRETLSGIFNLDWIPEIVFWYWWLFLLFLAVGAINWLFGWSKIVRIVTSVAFAAGAVFVAGGHVMWRKMKGRR